MQDAIRESSEACPQRKLVDEMPGEGDVSIHRATAQPRATKAMNLRRQARRRGLLAEGLSAGCKIERLTRLLPLKRIRTDAAARTWCRGRRAPPF